MAMNFTPPNNDIPDSVTGSANDLLARQGARTIGGLTGLGLPPGGRESSRDAAYGWMGPWSGALNIGASMLGIDTPQRGNRELANALRYARGGDVSDKALQDFTRSVREGRYADKWGTSTDMAGVSDYNSRAEVAHELITSGQIPGNLLQGDMSEGKLRHINDLISSYVRAASAAQQTNGGSLRGNVRKLVESGMGRHLTGDDLLRMVRMQQMMDHWKKPTRQSPQDRMQALRRGMRV